MPNWLTLILKWGGLALAIVAAVALVFVTQYASVPAEGAEPSETMAPITLYWVLLAVGAIAAIAGFSMGRGKPEGVKDS